MKTWTKVKYYEDFILYPKPLKSEAEGVEITGQPIAEVSSAPDGFVEVILADGWRGFVDGKVKVMSLKQIELRQIDASLYETASYTSPVLAKIVRGTVLCMFSKEPVVKADGKEWVSVITTEGKRGYILADTKVTFPKPRVETEPKDGAKNMLIGGGICAVGIVITAVTYSSASASGGTYVVAWGAILFGGIRFVWGLLQASGAQIR